MNVLRLLARAAVLAAVSGPLAVAYGQVGPRDVDPDRLLEAASTRPAGVVVYEWGKSAESRPIRAAMVAFPGPIPPGERPRLVIVAGLAADQAASALVAAALPGELLTLAAADPDLARLLKDHTVEILPLLAVDAMAAAANAPTQAWRKNARPVDDDRDAMVDEDGPNDLDQDGVITQLRVPDPLGEWRVSEEDPRLLVKADPNKGERGGWRLESEGLDDDRDGKIDEDGAGGVDFDRNFPHGRREFDRDAGVTAVSEPETKLLIDRILATKPCVAVLVLGRRDNLVEAPPGTGDGKFFPAVETEDRAWFEDIVKLRKERLPFTKKLDDSADGAFHQYAYAQLGVLAFASKVYEPPVAEKAESLPTGKPPTTDDGRMLLDSDRRLGGKGFVPWRPFVHPTLGPVEIGGFVPGAYLTPTKAEIPGLVVNHARFVLDVVRLFPQIELSDLKAAPQGGGLVEITAVVRNSGRIPTSLRVAQRTRTILPSRFEVDLPREAFVFGDPRTQLEPFGPGAGRKLRFVVRAAAGTEVAVRVRTEKAGSAEAKVVIPEGPR